MINVFIDGKEGTTGLQIYERLGKRNDVNIITLSEDLRKNVDARAQAINASDITFLCLPDNAAREAVTLVNNSHTKIIDASTAHRTNNDWAYGFAELSLEHRKKIEKSNRVANPGCHATGFISVIAPLISGNIVAGDYPFVINSLSGYSGAGKKTIAIYEQENRDEALSSPRQYAISQEHKHLPEIVQQCNLLQKPIFQPIICDYYCGMCVTVPLYAKLMAKKFSVSDLRSYLSEYYSNSNFIKVASEEQTPSFIAANELSGTNYLKIYVGGNADRIFLASVFDNLGKGASGAAVQNMNIMLGLDETTSLI